MMPSPTLIREDAQMSQKQEKVSDQMITLIQVIFGFVLAQAFAGYSVVVLSPWAHVVAFAALVAIFITTILSWIDWHTTMVEMPYKLYQAFWPRLAEEVRVLLDLLVVSIYAFAILSIDPLTQHTDGDATKYVWSYAAVFAAYVISGLLRRFTYPAPSAFHGHPASHTWLLVGFTVLYVVLALAYSGLRHIDHGLLTALNLLTIAIALALMVAFRVIHAVQRPLPKATTPAGS